MAKNQRNDQINRNIDSGQQASRDAFTGLNTAVSNRFNPVAEKSDNLWNETLTGYKGMVPKWGDLGERSLALGDQYGGEFDAQARKFNKYGDEIAGWARDRLDPTSESRMRGLGVYDEFAKTGGWSPEDKKVFLRNAATAAPRFMADVNRQVDAASLGNYNPGAVALKARIGRQGAQDAGNMAIGARQNMTESIREGMLAGAGGAATTEQALNDYYNQRYLGGMGLTGEYLSGATGALSQAGNARAAGLEGYGRSLEGEGNVYKDMQSLYGAVPNELMQLMELYSGNNARMAGADQGYIGQDIQNNPRKKEWWQYALDLGIPIGSQFLTKGLGSIGGGNYGDDAGSGARFGPWGFRGAPQIPSDPVDSAGLQTKRRQQLWSS